MKRASKRKAAIALALATVPLLMGCGKNKSNENVGSIPGSVAVGGCVPLNASIPFSASNAAMSGSYIRAGNIPGAGQYGTVVIGGSPVLNGFTYTNNINSEGTLSLSVANAQVANPTYPYNGTGGVSATGVLTISPAFQEYIRSRVQGTTSYPNPYPTGSFPQPAINQTLCVSSLAINGYLMNSGTPSIIGDVVLYLNGTNTWGVLQFQ